MKRSVLTVLLATSFAAGLLAQDAPQAHKVHVFPARGANRVATRAGSSLVYHTGGRVIPTAKFTFKPDAARQSILDSWPKSLDDSAARRDWGWKPRYDLEGMTQELIPKIRRMLELGAILSSH